MTDADADDCPMVAAALAAYDQTHADFLAASGGDIDAADCRTVTTLSLAHARAVAAMIGPHADRDAYVEAIQLAVAGLVQGIDLCLGALQRQAAAATVN